MGEFDAIGEAVTGSLLARAVEPRAGEGVGDGHTHEKNCLNCGSPLTGPFCAACGQRAHVHRSVRAFFQDFVQSLFNFEGKFWHTLPMLTWHPGEMTRRYIAGERARFISPIALYLFTVFAMFAVLNFTGSFGSVHTETVQQDLKEDIAKDQGKLAKLEAERKADAAAGKDTAKIDARIAKRKEDIAESQKVLTGQAFASGKIDDETPGWIRPLVEHARDNPDAVSTRIQDAASKYSWLLIPLSVPFMWLLFPFRRRYNTYDHTVFVTYSLSFMMLLVVAGSLLIAAGMPGLASLLFFVPPFHMYRQLKEAYGLGRFSAIVRTMALVIFAFIAAALFFAAATAIGAS
ncbi:MAG TPA: DUF3667 domain-containing protein [Sphingomicrobium sp.]|nr:DUF3667 domain-containing protein [Sphingomicrobium sp.]